MIGLWFFVDHTFGLGDLNWRKNKNVGQKLLVMSPFLFFFFFLGGSENQTAIRNFLGPPSQERRNCRVRRKRGELHLGKRRGRG